MPSHEFEDMGDIHCRELNTLAHSQALNTFTHSQELKGPSTKARSSVRMHVEGLWLPRLDHRLGHPLLEWGHSPT